MIGKIREYLKKQDELYQRQPLKKKVFAWVYISVIGALMFLPEVLYRSSFAGRVSREHSQALSALELDVLDRCRSRIQVSTCFDHYLKTDTFQTGVISMSMENGGVETPKGLGIFWILKTVYHMDMEPCDNLSTDGERELCINEEFQTFIGLRNIFRDYEWRPVDLVKIQSM